MNVMMPCRVCHQDRWSFYHYGWTDDAFDAHDFEPAELDIDALPEPKNRFPESELPF